MKSIFSQSEDHKQSGLVLLHISVFLLGHTTLFAKLLPFHAVTIIGIRSLLALLILGGITYLRQGIGFLRVRNFKDFCLFIFLGSLMTVHWITYFHSVQVSTIAIGMVSLFTYPVFTAILEPFFFRGSLRISRILIALYVFIGIGIVGLSRQESSFSELDIWGSGSLTGVFWGLLSAFLYSLRNLVAKKKLQDYSSSSLMIYQLIVCGILCFPFWEFEIELIQPKNIGLFLLLGIVFTAIAHTLFLKSLKFMQATTVGILSTISPVYGTLAAWLYLDEKPLLNTIIGGSIVISGSLFESWKVGRRKDLI